MSSKQDDVDAAIAAADPYPQAQVDDLAVDDAGRDLMETIMTSKQSGRRATLTDHPTSTGRRSRFLTPLVAAAAVTAVVAGGMALRGMGGEDPQPEAGPASGPSSTTNPTEEPKAKKKSKAPNTPVEPAGPGLPPTGDNLHHVIGGQDWVVVNMDDDPQWGGSLAWEAPGVEAEMVWYPAADYQSYLADRRDVGPAEQVDLLHQTGQAFTYPSESPGGVPSPGEKDSPLQKSPRGTGEASSSTTDEESGDTRVAVLLPPVGNWFLEFNVTAADRAAVDAAFAQLSRVSPQEWQDSLGQDVVRPAGAEAFLTEAAQGVPMPDGVEVTAEDLSLPQSAYHARIAFLSPVLCGWAEDYVNGNDGAIDVLRGSKDWPVVKALSPEGDFGSTLADVVRDFAKDRDLEGFRQGVC